MADPNSMLQGPAGMPPYGTLYRPPTPTQPLGGQQAYDANGAPPVPPMGPPQNVATPPQPPTNMGPPTMNGGPMQGPAGDSLGNPATPLSPGGGHMPATAPGGLGSGNPQVPSSPFDGHNPNSFLSRMFGMSGSQSQQPFVHPNSLVGRFAHLFY